MSIYSDIISIQCPDDRDVGFKSGHKVAIACAAKVALSADVEIEKLTNGITKLQSIAKTLLILSKRRFNEGVEFGQKSIANTLIETAELRESYLDENDRLTTLLLSHEDEIERLKSILEEARSVAQRQGDNKELLDLLSACPQKDIGMVVK